MATTNARRILVKSDNGEVRVTLEGHGILLESLLSPNEAAELGDMIWHAAMEAKGPALVQ